MSTATLQETISRIRAVDWTGTKRAILNGHVVTSETTVGELAEAIRDRLGLPRGSYAVYDGDRRLNRTDSLLEAGVQQDVELELSPEVKAA